MGLETTWGLNEWQAQGGVVMDLESIIKELDKVVAVQQGYADGEPDETNEWHFRFVVRGPVVDHIIPDRMPEVRSSSSEGREWWWTLPDGTIVGRYYEEDGGGLGCIIPPDACDPPPVKDYCILSIPAWVPVG